MASQQLPPWLLMNAQNQQPVPLNLSSPITISLDNPNPGMSLADANAVIEQQRQAANLGLQQNQAPTYRMASARTPEEDALIKQVSESYGEQRKVQEQAIKQAEEQLAAARQVPQQMDLSPLIALSQSWSQRPSNLLQAYQRPTDQSKTVQALQEAVLKARGGAAELEGRRAKDVQQMSLQERQLRSNEELKRLSIEALKKGKDEKGDTKALDREITLIGKITGSDEAKAIRGATQMNNAINNYINTINKHKGNILDKQARAEIGNAYESTIMAFKAAEELGALQKEDVARAQAKLPDVASFYTAAQRFGGLAPNVDTAVEIIKQIPQEYGARGKLALDRLKSGYGKFGGQDIINQFESGLNASMQSGSSLEQKREMIKRARAQGGLK